MTTSPEAIDLSPIAGLTFVQGKGDGKRTACIMSAVSILRGLEFNDAPACVAPEIRSLAISGNDAAWWKDDTERTKVLMPIVPLLLGTMSTDRAVIERRVRLMVLAAIRVFTPIALDAAKFHSEAEKLRALPDGVGYETLEAAVWTASVAKAAWAAARAAEIARTAAKLPVRAAWLQLLKDVCAIKETE